MKRKLLVCTLGVLMLTGCGKEAISKENFENGLNNFIKSETNAETYTANIKDDKINVTYWDENYTLTYNLKEEPTITYEVEIKKGISYEEYTTKTSALSLPMLGYFAIADNKGIEPADYYTYFSNTYLDGMFDAVDLEKESYIITDDAEGYDESDKLILTSEFGNKVIDYIEYTYDKDIKIEDEEYDTYSYELTTECSDNSCVFTAKLTINTKADFSKINGYEEKIAKEGMDENITPENADYNIELVAGQSITISGKKLNGYEQTGMDIVEVEKNDSEYIFKATKAGVANGYFYIGEDSTRTYYLTVTEATGDDKIEDITLKIK